jgi:hypothetical protein
VARYENLPLEAVQPGDLLFFNRPSLIQSWSDTVDDEFRGVAIADRRDGQLVMLQCGHPGGFEVRVVADLVNRYDMIGVGRAPECACVDDMLAWAWQRMEDDNHYPLTSLLPAFFLSWARNTESGRRLLLRRALVVPAVALVASVFSIGGHLRSGRSWTFICSTFVAAASAGGCPAHRLDRIMGRSKADPRLQGSLLGQILERWYSTPSDLWRATSEERRFLLDLDLTSSGTADRSRALER